MQERKILSISFIKKIGLTWKVSSIHLWCCCLYVSVNNHFYKEDVSDVMLCYLYDVSMKYVGVSSLARCKSWTRQNY